MSRPLQLDLFADRAPDPGPATVTPRPAASDLPDTALIAALPDNTLSHAVALAAEAGRRRLVGAVEPLAQLCRRFAGFGAERAIPEQVAALEALAEIGGAAAARAVARLVETEVVEGPNLAPAVIAAARLGARFAPEVAARLLEHPDPATRAAACACARAGGAVTTALIARLSDRDGEVAIASACALGRMGRPEALGPLKRLLRERPSPRVVEALAAIADEEAVVLLGRAARERPELSSTTLAALDEIDHPKAIAVARTLRKPEGT